MSVSWSELIRVFGRIGLLSFGGPAAQIALMHRELVETRDWLSEEQYLRALSFCMLLPGPEAMQLATYAGWRLRGTPGGLIAGGLFVLPGALVIMALAIGYATLGALDWVQALFLGIKAAVVVIVIEALLKLSRRSLTDTFHVFLAVTGFVAVFVFAVPFPLVIIAAALLGAVLAAKTHAPPQEMPKANTVKTLAIWGTLWLLPLLAIFAIEPDFLAPLALFFSKLAVVSFGGAYAGLAYMTQTVVQDHGWITTTQMIDALGLAETTPGPLILVTEFIATLAGYTRGGLGLAMTAALVSLWMTFVPCFLWIFAGAPYVEWLSSRPRPAAALKAISATVVGVIASLSLWFALHVLFETLRSGPLAFPVPDWQSFQPLPLLLTVLAGYLLFWRHWSIGAVLALCAIGGLVDLVT